MGFEAVIQASKELAEHLALADSQSGPRGIEDIVFENEAFMECLKTFWGNLPARIKSKITASQHRGFSAVSKSSEKITLSAVVEPYYNTWRIDASTFLKQDTNLHSCFRLRPVIILYSLISKLRERREVDEIRWRFLVLTLYRFQEVLKSSNYRYVCGIFVNIIIESGLIGDDETNIKQNVNEWVNAGKRYDTLVKELGDGCLIVLPKDITAHEWKKKIPLTGPTHDYAIKSLKDRGILEEAARIDADFVATAIFQHVWALLDFLSIDRVQETSHQHRDTLLLALADATQLHVLADAAILHQQFQNRPIDNLVSPVPGRAPPIAGYVSNNEHTEG
ncbi:hypothetical protein AJ78_07956 [Emergomyces pasteurianus Ep9510]|uniref:Uncharacterized protein n=1 Tax=Emergomyces pasteurianus Ep9510 TaxID=1447872 RepID=A0A1J9P3A9_9EURO|nr:hypothetical protein AJ78_07956 [Emergomyces pasteurianus Ep9510]